MSNASEIRARHIDHLRHVLGRPAMYGGTAFGVGLVMRNLIDDLGFIDEIDSSIFEILQSMECRALRGCCGVAGCFAAMFGETADLCDEVASVHATVAYRLGFLAIESPRPAAEIARMRKGLRAACRDRDWRASEIADRFGPASLAIGTTVLAYVPDDPSAAWVYFDFDQTSAISWEDRDHLLRNVRLPASQFKRAFAFTPHGRRLFDETPKA